MSLVKKEKMHAATQTDDAIRMTTSPELVRFKIIVMDRLRKHFED